MGVRTGNATWQDSPSTATLITAATLNAIEAAIDASMPYPRIVPKVGAFLTTPDITSYFTASGQFRVAGTCSPAPVYVGKTITVDAMAVQVDTLAAATNIRMGLYSSDSDGFPTTKLAEVSVSGAATGLIVGTFTGVVLNPGIYWTAAYGSSNATLRIRMIRPASQGMIGVGAGVMPVGANQWLSANFGDSTALTGTISSWSQDFPDQVPLIGLRRSA